MESHIVHVHINLCRMAFSSLTQKDLVLLYLIKLTLCDMINSLCATFFWKLPRNWPCVSQSVWFSSYFLFWFDRMLLNFCFWSKKTFKWVTLPQIVSHAGCLLHIPSPWVWNYNLFCLSVFTRRLVNQSSHPQRKLVQCENSHSLCPVGLIGLD